MYKNLMCFRCDNTQSAAARKWNIDSLRSLLAMQIGYSLRSRTSDFYKLSDFLVRGLRGFFSDSEESDSFFPALSVSALQ